MPLVDMLKEAVLRTGCLDAVTSVSDDRGLSPEVLAECLLRVIYAYGTNTGPGTAWVIDGVVAS
ncbi:hypothetical protein [Streptomyces sp. NPDC092295]|uniref:hypothetical protein n=1 Tax=Streptomyces sp. NPDC092295 TaxID=3366011 RepID=UPI00382D6F13